ncbi:hypothetical protein [Nocardioides taihuensis]|uniref:Uncharacterized protein n=1 Tax=Nocardioides taihuensis TaxID=1835606 RepID=A0ABW0BKE0_9ACTN
MSLREAEVAMIVLVNEVTIVQVDERDSRWEENHPRYRVYLFGSADETTAGWTDTYDVTGADVLQVIDWAQRQAGDSLTYAVALVYDAVPEQISPGPGRGLVWLVGMDGNDQPTWPGEREVQQRMLARRREPVSVSLVDRMPPDVPDPYGGGTRTR